MLASRSAFIIVGLLFSAGLGFYVGQSPIPQLQQEMELINQNNTDLQNTLFQIEEEHREFKNELQNARAHEYMGKIPINYGITDN
jgi:hypothetical protein